jgi:hypothetical protein
VALELQLELTPPAGEGGGLGIAGIRGNVGLEIGHVRQRGGVTPLSTRVSTPAIVHARTLGGKLAALLEPLADAERGVVERFRHRHASVLVGVGADFLEGADEELGEDGLEHLCRRIRGSDHDSSGTGDVLKERRAAAGRVDEDEPSRNRLDERRPFDGRQIRAHEVELRILTLRRSMADEQDEHHIVGLDLPR